MADKQDDTIEIVKALLITAGTLKGAADNASVYMGGKVIVPITSSSCADLAKLMERAAAALMKRDIGG